MSPRRGVVRTPAWCALGVVAVLSALSAVAAGCGGSSDDAPSRGAAGAAGAAQETAFVCPDGLVLHAGKNEGVSIAGRTRTFTIDIPKAAPAMVPVVFEWHGFGDTADNFSAMYGLTPDGDPDFAFVRVVPEALSLMPAQGLDWAIFDTGEDGEQNPDLALFEAINGCLRQDFGADPDRLYSVGFSAGALMTNLLHARYPHDLAAIVSYSGAWLNDEPEAKGINTLGYKVVFAWPPLSPTAAGPILLTHGGPADTYSFNGQKVIDFEASAASAIPFLRGAGRDVIACAHTKGHAIPGELGAKLATAFFKAHVRGQPSGWATLPESVPSSCSR